MWRLSKYLLLAVLFVVFAIVIAGSVIGLYYQDEVRQYMINEINRHVDSEIVVRDLSFSVLRKFPQASIEFKDVFIGIAPGYEFCQDQGKNTDTLFTAESVFLQFNIRDIFRKQYSINRVLAINGVFNMAVNASDQVNYRIWKTPGQNGNGFTIDLNDVSMAGYRVRYSNCITRTYLDSDLKRLEMKGNFSESSFNIKCFVQGYGNEFRQKNYTYNGKKEISASVVLNGNGKEIKIQEGKVGLSGIRLAVTGKYETGEPGYMNIEVTGTNIDIMSVTGFLGQVEQNNLKLYRFNGKFDFTASVSGRYGNNFIPAITASFFASKGEIKRIDTGLKLTEIAMKGNYTNGSNQNAVSSAVFFNHFSARFGNGKISGKGNITNFVQPSADLDISASILLDELAEFYKPENIINMGGRIETDFSMKGTIPAPGNWDMEEFYKMDIKGKLKIEKGLLEISKSKHIASDIGGLLYFGNTLRAENLDFKIGNDHLSISGTIENGLPWLLNDNEVMNISGNLYSGNLNLDNYIISSGKTSRHESSEQLPFPSNLELSLDFLIDDMWFGKFHSTKFKGKLSYKPGMMILNAIEFVSMDGNISGNGVIAQRHNREFILQSQLQMQNIDIQKMFLTFNNFGQSFIHGEHLKGILSGNLGLICEWTPELDLKWERLIADSKVEIRNGELVSFEPMLGLARFIHVSELNHIWFSTLNNEIFIRNQVITIPQMDVNSTAFNISGSGTHHFDGRFDYRLRVLLSDVLYGKAGKAKPENHKFGIVEDDRPGRTGLHLQIAGTTDNYKVSYDHRTVRDVLRQNVASERRILKQLLNEEFRWFSRDENIQTAPEPAMENRIRISWDEENEAVTSPENPTSPQPVNSPVIQPGPGNSEKKFQIVWDEEENPGY
jgi:hypothetical protein